MNGEMAQTKVQDRLSVRREDLGVVMRLANLIPGVQRRTSDDDVTDAVTVRGPSYLVRASEAAWKDLACDTSEESIESRRCLLDQIRTVLSSDRKAKDERRPWSEVARQMGEACRRTLESAWVSILDRNKPLEETIRAIALGFSNMQDSRKVFKGKIFVIDVSPEEISSDTGRDLLARYLSEFADRPDPRASRGFVVVPGWVGGSVALERLGRVVHAARAVLVTDAPSFDSLEDLEAASKEGGLLEKLSGEKVWHRHMVVIANKGRAREAFVGKYAREERDTWVPMSLPWFGSYLDNVAQGQPWKPACGYRNPIAGVDSTLLDLRLTDQEGFRLYLDHRLNPCILRASGSEDVVLWGADALSRSGKGVQIGVAVVEMLVARYTEWVINRYGILDELQESETVCGDKLSEFVTLNSGAGRMFRAGSKVSVKADLVERCLIVEFDLLFREVAERAQIRINKPVTRGKPGELTVTD